MQENKTEVMGQLTSWDDVLSAASIKESSCVSFFILLKDEITFIGTAITKNKS